MVKSWLLLYGGCCGQVSIFVSLVEWSTGGCGQVSIVVPPVVWKIDGSYCKVVAVAR